jgi:hypothetical protein
MFVGGNARRGQGPESLAFIARAAGHRHVREPRRHAMVRRTSKLFAEGVSVPSLPWGPRAPTETKLRPSRPIRGRAWLKDMACVEEVDRTIPRRGSVSRTSLPS